MYPSFLLPAVFTLSFVPSLAAALPSYNHQTGHYYDFVHTTTSLTWQQAREEAIALEYNDLPGYLATITSTSENNFVSALAPASHRTSWLGGTDEVSEGDWVWADGPEAGTQLDYANWAAGEPNNVSHSSAGEDYLHMWSDGTWNDLPSRWQLQGYFIEYSHTDQGTPVPEPSGAIALILFGVLASLNLKHTFRRH